MNDHGHGSATSEVATAAGPDGTCPECDGDLIWGRMRYQPRMRVPGDPDARGGWLPSDPMCANALRTPSHPCAVTRRQLLEPAPAKIAVTAGR